VSNKPISRRVVGLWQRSRRQEALGMMRKLSARRKTGKLPGSPPPGRLYKYRWISGRASRPFSAFLIPLAAGFRNHLSSGPTPPRHPPNPPGPFGLAKSKLPRHRQTPRSVDIRSICRVLLPATNHRHAGLKSFASRIRLEI
jgi:hypothetical protein